MIVNRRPTNARIQGLALGEWVDTWYGKRYIDPNRPAWYPTWDFTPEELAMTIGLYPGVSTLDPLPSPPQPSAPTVPEGGYSGSVTDPDAISKMLAASKEAQVQQSVDFFKTVADAEARNKEKPGDDEDWFSKYKWWLLGGAVGLGVLTTIGGQRGAEAASKAAKTSTIASALPVLLVVGGGLLLVGTIGGGLGAASLLTD